MKIEHLGSGSITCLEIEPTIKGLLWALEYIKEIGVEDFSIERAASEFNSPITTVEIHHTMRVITLCNE